MNKEKWYHPEVKDTGWNKDESQGVRRNKMLAAHKWNYLASGRALVSLANVTEDAETRMKARNDALYFFRVHRQQTRELKSRGIKLTPRVRRLPR